MIFQMIVSSSLSQNIPLKKYLESKVALISLSIVVMFLLSIPYVYFGWKALAINFACAAYNFGVNIPVILFFGSFNRKRIDLTKSALGNMLHLDCTAASSYASIVLDGTLGGMVAFQDDTVTKARIYADSNGMVIDNGSTQWAKFSSTGNFCIGTSSPAKQLHITKAAIADIGALTDGATITPDFDANQNFSVTLGGNRTLANPTNIDAGQTGSIFITQDGTGSRTLSFGSDWDFAGGTAPTLSTAAGAVDRIDYIVRTGTSIHAVATLNLS